MGEVSVDPEDIIAAVRARPVLWGRRPDTETVERSKTTYATAWQQVFQQVVPGYNTLPAGEKDVQGKLIMKKWRNIKDQYVKTVKRNNLRGPSGRKYKKYIYHHLLTFIEVNNQEESPLEDKEVKKEPEFYYPLEQSHNSGYDISDENTEYLPAETKEYDASFPAMLLAESVDTETDEKTAASCRSPRASEVDCGPRDNRHVWFFKSVVPSLADFDDDETLQFQSAVINTIVNIKKSRRLSTS